ncbi:DUF3822 family protein [Mucilaginibacter sp.]|uniref:DUF3822 family protein n=1 Tax=Mucilaginibacter sp. TaxID=1882438 RepID=UPI0035BC6A61
MSEQKHQFTHDSFSLSRASSYNLLLQINAGSFNYAICADKQLLAWAENFPLEELKNPQNLRDVLTANYGQVIVGLASTGFTLVPTALFDKDRVADLARFLDVQDNEDVYAQPVDDANVVVYKINQYLSSTLNDFDYPVINYNAKGWIKAVANNHPLDKTLYVNLTKDVVEILNFNNESIRFYNTFTYKNHEELAYYCTFAANELALTPDETTIVLSGDISDTDRCFTFLKEFFIEVKLNYTEVLSLPQDVQPHKILTLAALLLCVSSEED